MGSVLSVDRDALAALCRRHHIRKLALFGSALREDLKEHDDIDVLVHWGPGALRDAFGIFDVEEALSTLFGGRKVELTAEKSLFPRMRASIVASAEVIYDEDA